MACHACRRLRNPLAHLWLVPLQLGVEKFALRVAELDYLGVACSAGLRLPRRHFAVTAIEERGLRLVVVAQQGLRAGSASLQ